MRYARILGGNDPRKPLSAAKSPMESAVTDLTHEDIRKIIELVDAAEHLDEVELVYGGFRLHLRRGGSGAAGIRAAAPIPAGKLAPAVVASVAPAKPGAAPEQPLAEGVVAVRSPMLGTFYRAPSPGEKPFTQVGERVKTDDTVCLIEVMKLFNSIRAGVDGTVVEIAVANGSLVEYNQVVILIDTGNEP